MTPATKNRPINCFQCKNFYITYEADHPYGCRGLSFKSKELPSIVVYTNSGMQCQLFVPKG